MTNTPMTFEEWLKTKEVDANYGLHRLSEYRTNMCKEVWKACQAHNDAVIAELKTRIGDVTQMYQEKLDERDKTIAELREDLLDLRKQVNYRCADVQRLTELNIELVEAADMLLMAKDYKENVGKDDAYESMKNIAWAKLKAVTAKHKKVTG